MSDLLEGAALLLRDEVRRVEQVQKTLGVEVQKLLWDEIESLIPEVERAEVRSILGVGLLQNNEVCMEHILVLFFGITRR